MNTEIIDAPTLSAVKVYNPIEQGIALLMEKHGHVITVPPDVSTPSAMNATRKNRMELVKFRTRIEAARKEEKAASLAYGRLVDSEAARITAIAAPIERAYDDAITAEEQRLDRIEQEEIEREQARRQALQARVDEIRNLAFAAVGKPLAYIEGAIAALTALNVDETFEEYKAAAVEARASTLTRLDGMVMAAREIERKNAELEAQRIEMERVRKEQAEAQRVEAERQRVEAERQRIEMEAQRAEIERVRREQAEAQARLDEQARLQAAEIAKAVVPVVEEPLPVPDAAPEIAADNAVDTPRQPETLPSLTLEQINGRLGFAMSNDLIAWLGVAPVAEFESSKFYSEGNFLAICAALKDHIDRVSDGWLG